LLLENFYGLKRKIVIEDWQQLKMLNLNKKDKKREKRKGRDCKRKRDREK
jgi:hypothetical protein